MSEDRTQDRTEQATPRRREEARERGQVATSSDLGQAVLLLTGILVLWYTSRQLGKMLVELTNYELQDFAYAEFNIQHVVVMMRIILGRVAEGVLPMLVVLAVVAIGVNAAQVGIRITFQPLSLNWSRLSIPKGWERIFSIRSAVRGVMMVAKVSVGLGVLGGYMWSNRHYFVGLGRRGLVDSAQETWTNVQPLFFEFHQL